jgi:hypothetical protein
LEIVFNLLVQASDGQGQALPLVAGPTVPAWGGVGDQTKGYYAGLPGKGFAKVLEERLLVSRVKSYSTLSEW